MVQGSTHRGMWKSELSVPKKSVLYGLFGYIFGEIELEKRLAGPVFTGLRSINTKKAFRPPEAQAGGSNL